ncbi:MAG: Ig-like domain-containing protein, partial [Nitrospira sp.]
TSEPSHLTNVNGRLYFVANTSATGTELWKSDGTAGGTVLVKNITSGAGHTIFRELEKVGSQLFFHAQVNGIEMLWKSNGTEAGTIALAASGLTLPQGGGAMITDINGLAYFRANNHDLWRSDGTVAGTVRVLAGANVHELANVNDSLFFSGVQVGTGQELMKVTKANVLTNDRDPEGKPLTAALVTGPTKGTLTFNANGTFTYRPNAGFIGTDSFTYRASDGTATSNLATVTITVTA